MHLQAVYANASMKEEQTCTRTFTLSMVPDGNLLTCKMELRLARFVFSKEDDDEESVKIMFYVYFVPCGIISYNFLHAVTF